MTQRALQAAVGSITDASQDLACPEYGHVPMMRCQPVRTHAIQVSREKSKTNVAAKLLKGEAEGMHMTTATQGGGSF
jgi:hypothetical protein